MAEEKKIIKKVYDKGKNLTKKAPPQKCDSYEQAAPPDGGWGWVVVFASFMIHVVTDGVVYSFGELFKVILDKYNEGAGKTSLIPSILVGTTLCSGPIASAFVNKFGCRPVTIAGSIISASCILLSIYANSLEMLMLTMGLGTGIGFGLIYLPAIVSVTCYFEKYRSIATGIGVCGSGFGTVIFAPIMNISLELVHLEGTYMMIAAVVLTCVLYGMLLRPVPSGEKEPEVTTKINVYSPDNVPLTTVTSADDVNITELYNNGEANGCRRYSIHDVSDLKEGKDRLRTQNSVSQFVSQPTLMITDMKFNKSNLSLASNHSGIMYRKDVFFTGSIRSIKDISKSNGYLPAPQVQPPVIHKSKSTEKEKYSCIPCSMECQDTMAEMTDFSLLRDLIFVIFVISNFLTSLGFNLPYLYIPKLIEEKKLPETWSSHSISAIGVGNTLGRIILGYASDNPGVNRLMVYNTCLTFCGIACVVGVFCWELMQFLAFAFIFGFTTGAYVGLTSVITVDLFGLDKLTNAFGILLLFQGIASFIGPPLAGYFIDRFSSYDYSFYIAGVTICLSGSMLYFVPAIQRYLQRRKLNCDSSVS